MADRLSKLEKAYSRHPELPLFARLADLYLRRNMPFRALEICEKGCEHFPDYTTGFLILSKCYQARGDLEAARKAMGRALRLDPENPVGFKRLSTIYQELGNSELAVKSLEQAARLDPLDQQVGERLDQLIYSMRLESVAPAEEHFDVLPQEVRKKPETFVLEEEKEAEEIDLKTQEDARAESPAWPDEDEEEPVFQETALATELDLSPEEEGPETGFLEDQEEAFEEFEDELAEPEEETIEGLGDFEEEELKAFEEDLEAEIPPAPAGPLAPESEMEPDLSTAAAEAEGGLWDEEEPGLATAPANGDPLASEPEPEPADLAEDAGEDALDDGPEPLLPTAGVSDLGDVVAPPFSEDAVETDEEPALEDSRPAAMGEDTAAVESPEDTLEEIPSIEDLVYSMEAADSASPAEEEDYSPEDEDSPGVALAALGDEIFIDEVEDLEPAPVAPVEKTERPEPASDLEVEDEPDESDQDDDWQKIAAEIQDEPDAPPPDSPAPGPPPSRRFRETGSNAVSGLGPRDDDELIKLFQEIEAQQTQELKGHAALPVSAVPALPEDEAAEDEDEADRQIATVTLAEIYTIQGLTQRAIDIYRQILDHNPDNEEIRSKLADLERGAKP